ncbi:VOC family protein [Parasegetibacter sp. NRK P23]|uniref:VOC family protein n=1 Tax=Parasegetibacter sp. NRK P23 TaxID=2942999 RepID=UPI002043761A|nr:VOC family protein [Parasegetibacter sp. NRK P23]MCM5528601.1 VOC family protein [Parasegetibacter sp. NRK P23]
MAAVNPYLTFNGNCASAFLFYKEVFGGTFIHFIRFNAVENESREEGNKVMHVSLPIGNGTILMGSDAPSTFGELVMGQNMAVSVSTSSETEVKRIYNALSREGVVVIPLEKTFWGALFGLFYDRFGVQWMVNYDYAGKN